MFSNEEVRLVEFYESSVCHKEVTFATTVLRHISLLLFHNLAIILGPLYELRLLTKYFMLEKLCSIAPPQALIASYYDNDFRGN